MSDGVKTDAIPPELSSARKVKELSRNSSPADADFVADKEELSVSWENVFIDAQAAIRQFDVCIGV